MFPFDIHESSIMDWITQVPNRTGLAHSQIAQHKGQPRLGLTKTRQFTFMETYFKFRNLLKS
jgi:hypothetical protein